MKKRKKPVNIKGEPRAMGNSVKKTILPPNIDHPPAKRKLSKYILRLTKEHLKKVAIREKNRAVQEKEDSLRRASGLPTRPSPRLQKEREKKETVDQQMIKVVPNQYGQCFKFKSFRLNVASPDDIKMWTTRTHFSTSDIEDRLGSYITDEPQTNKQTGFYLSGKLYKNTKALWDPNSGGLLKKYERKLIKSELAKLRQQIDTKRVINAQTLNYKTLEPEEGGLFCQKIFGKVDDKDNRRHQLGYINLAIPITHVWYLKTTPSPLAILLDQKKRHLEKLTYFTARCSRGADQKAFNYTDTNYSATIKNRQKYVHFSHSKTFWLNQTVSFKALKHSLFNSCVQTDRFEKFFNRKETSFFAWNDFPKNQSTDDYQLQYLFLSKPWVLFLGPNNETYETKLSNVWQQQMILETNHLLKKGFNKTRYWSQTPTVKTFQLNFWLLSELAEHLVVFNTVNTFPGYQNKKTVLLLKSSPHQDQLVQNKVESTYSPVLRAFYNKLWSPGNHTGKLIRMLRTIDHSFTHTVSLDQSLKKYKHWGTSKPESSSINFPYKKAILFSTFQQSLNDDQLSNTRLNAHDFFKQIGFIIQSQLVCWNLNAKTLSLVSELVQLNDSWITKKFQSNGLNFLQTSWFTFYSFPFKKLFMHVNKKELPYFKRKAKVSFHWGLESKEKQKELFNFVPQSLYTRMLKITPQGKVEKVYLLPFLDEDCHFRYETIQKFWSQMNKHVDLDKRRMDLLGNPVNKKRPNPLGKKKFRQFLKNFFQLSMKKNYFVSLLKKTKTIIMSSWLQSEETSFYIGNFKNKTLDKQKISFFNQLDYEKSKYISHFLNNFILLDGVVHSVALLSKNPKIVQMTQKNQKKGKKVKRKKSRKQTLTRVAAFSFQQNKIMGQVEMQQSLNSLKSSAKKKPSFSVGSSFFQMLAQQPFCYYLKMKKVANLQIMPMLLNPFFLQDKSLMIRFSQTEGRDVDLQDAYHFVFKQKRWNKKNKSFFQKNTKVNGLLPNSAIMMNKKKETHNEKWRKVSIFDKNIPIEFSILYPELDKDELSVHRGYMLREFIKEQKGAYRNVYPVVPTLFIWRVGRPVDEEWLTFEYYMESKLEPTSIIIPSYVERVVYDRPYRYGGEVIYYALKNFFQSQQQFTVTHLEVEENKQRRAENDSSLFSDDHLPIFHERLLSDPPKKYKPIKYWLGKFVLGYPVFVSWLQQEIKQADPIIYDCEKLLKTTVKDKPVVTDFAATTLSSFHLKQMHQVNKKLKKKKKRQWPYPKTYIDPYLNATRMNYFQPFFYPKIYKTFALNSYRRFKMIRMLKLMNSFLKKPTIKPESMMLATLPVLPPDLRPVLVLGDDQFVISDLNKLYQQVIYRNNRLYSLHSPYMNFVEENYYALYGKRLLQEAVDALLANGKGNAAPTVSLSDQPLKSLSDMLKGKQGRFRQNLLGKRVDYSGRSVIVVGPQLKIYECGLPKEMAVELFKPFLMQKLIDTGRAKHSLSAKRMIKAKNPVIWVYLKEIMADRPVLLNRAPTLHRLGMQAFQPKLISGRAILLHPLVCSAYNADFDGDQMGVHIPLSQKACSEAWKLMWSRNNILSPATGDPNLTPSQDMVLGCYYVTTMDTIRRFKELQQNTDEGSKTLQVQNSLPFQSISQILSLVQMQQLNYHSVIWLKWPHSFELENKKQRCVEIQMDSAGHIIKIYPDYKVYYHSNYNKPIYFIKTTPGRALLNKTLLDVLNK